MIDPGFPSLHLNIVVCLLLAVVSALALYRRGWRALEARMLAIFAWLGIAGLAAQYAVWSGWLVMPDPAVLERLPQYIVLLLTWAGLGFTIAFTRSGGRSPQRWMAGLLPLVVLIVLDSNAFHLPEIVWRSPTQILTRSSITWYSMDGACLVLLFSAFWVAIGNYGQARQPLHRNRLAYLLPVLVLISAAAILVFSSLVILALAVLLLASLLMAYMAIIHRLPDLKQITRQVVSYLILAVVTFAVIAAGYIGASDLFAGQNGYTPVWFGAAIAALLATLVNPLLAIIRRLVDRLLSGPAYRSSQVVSEYGQQTNNILDIKRLAEVAVGFISATLRSERGRLALVDLQSDDGQPGYHLTEVDIDGLPALDPGFLRPESPIAAQFCRDRRPFTQYDLDFLPEFQSADPSELSWFHASGMDVYIPIIANDIWIGLLLLGPKNSGDRYTAEDLSLLSAIASQTAVSLENARLVSHLETLNRELKSAYSNLENAKQKLERLDRVKTDFISIASHELRTPLTLVVGYSDMLAAVPPPNAGREFLQTLAGIQGGAARMHEIIDTMLDVARIDSSTLELDISRVKLPVLVRAVQATLESTFQERQIQYQVVEETSLPEIEADPNELQKVLSHLSSNALKYTPNGGGLEIRLRTMDPDESPLGRSSVEVVYSDTGIGIAPDTFELIFTKFYQTGPVALHSSGKSKFKGGGPGLGLAIVRGIVEAHAGVVWVESPGHDEKNCPGSCFHVVLPVVQPHLAFENRPTIPLPREAQPAG